jgi:hypothetical protein
MRFDYIQTLKPARKLRLFFFSYGSIICIRFIGYNLSPASATKKRDASTPFFSKHEGKDSHNKATLLLFFMYLRI